MCNVCVDVSVNIIEMGRTLFELFCICAGAAARLWQTTRACTSFQIQHSSQVQQSLHVSGVFNLFDA